LFVDMVLMPGCCVCGGNGGGCAEGEVLFWLSACREKAVQVAAEYRAVDRSDRRERPELELSEGKGISETQYIDRPIKGMVAKSMRNSSYYQHLKNGRSIFHTNVELLALRRDFSGRDPEPCKSPPLKAS
jgi:hypothetical protein